MSCYISLRVVTAVAVTGTVPADSAAQVRGRVASCVRLWRSSGGYEDSDTSPIGVYTYAGDDVMCAATTYNNVSL